MLETLHHRGEDEQKDEFYDDCCGLGIARLSIMDLKGGMQPLHTNGKEISCVFNGMIYNTLTIQSDLRGEGIDLPNSNDGVVIPFLYQKFGPMCAAMLDGMFAFLCYDHRNKSFCAARDPIGIKPLYYVRTGAGAWYISSEIKSFQKVNVPLANIKSLPPGHYITSENPVPVQYYVLPFVRAIPDKHMVATLLEHAVSKRMLADVEVGTFLSGGIDSSIVTMLASRFKKDIHAITVGNEGSPDVEAAKKVAEHLGIRHTIKSFTPEELRGYLDRAVFHCETYNPVLVTGGAVTLMAAEAAKQAGITVVLCGEGADELFAGYKAMRFHSPLKVYDGCRDLMNMINHTECKRLDRMTMAVSLEARTPFLDLGVVQYALNLPYDAKIKEVNGRLVEKHILREAFDGTLPDSVIWREKMPFDQGSGSRKVLLEAAAAAITDEEYAQLQRAHPNAQLQSKEMAYYWKVWYKHFGETGGEDMFNMFGYYPVLQANMNTRTADSGS
eukprot:CAMPEP_0177633898 /NCGR_PEP_ID=MMETSP0447-20121125/3084_1 /TAXON_ID=0 /ORGANISM="Stygamoeba regulata, Strain BSH-02190019" /LENGTH=498 /DNA_ID=CAMNT_0019135591 /DNA_START=105 /DNA_END=1601 /DNA_ORIENTATION=-